MHSKIGRKKNRTQIRQQPQKCVGSCFKSSITSWYFISIWLIWFNKRCLENDEMMLSIYLYRQQPEDFENFNFTGALTRLMSTKFCIKIQPNEWVITLLKWCHKTFAWKLRTSNDTSIYNIQIINMDHRNGVVDSTISYIYFFSLFPPCIFCDALKKMEIFSDVSV